MPHNASKLNDTTAPLTNVALFLSATERAMQRPGHLPGFVTFTSPAGYGKTTAAIYSINKYRSYYVECKDSWNRKSFLLNLCKDMGLQPAATISDMVDQICEQLATSRRPLVIDQVDNIITRGYIETVRDIHDGAGNAPIILIGEDMLNTKLKRWERVHSRILAFVLAQPADLSDAQHLRNLYCRKVQIADDLLAHIHKKANGSARRICTNLEEIQSEAMSRGLDKISLADARDIALFSGEPPKRGL